MSNLSILDRNILFGLREPAQDYYLKQRDRLSPLAAEQAAWEWERVQNLLSAVLPLAAEQHGLRGAAAAAAIDGVTDFICTRHTNMRPSRGGPR